MTTRISLIRKAAVIALTGNALLAGIKLCIGIMTGSLAVLGDGIDSASDVLISAVALAVSVIISKPSDQEYPFGRGRQETIASMLLVFMIFAAGIEVIVSSAKKIIAGDFIQEVSLLALSAPLISIAGKFILMLTQRHLGIKANSDIIKANASNMKNDILLSGGVLAGLAISKFFKAPVIDPIVAIITGLLVLKNACELFIDLNRELMDGNADKELYKKLFNAVASVDGVSNPHRARIRKIASLFDISLDIEVDPMITVYEAHEKAELVEEAIRKEIPDLFDVMIHIEPAGSDEHQRPEEFGLTPEKLD